MIKTGFKSSENPHCGQSEATKHFAGSHHHHIQDSSLFDMYQHGTPIVLNGKLLKNPNLASHYACMRRHLGVIYGQAKQCNAKVITVRFDLNSHTVPIKSIKKI